jgi:hypothetical protein
MTTPQYMISSVMLDEHRHNIERSMPNPDWPEPVPSRRPARFAGARQRISDGLLALADRLEPADDRSRSGNRGTWASEPMR